LSSAGKIDALEMDKSRKRLEEESRRLKERREQAEEAENQLREQRDRELENQRIKEEREFKAREDKERKQREQENTRKLQMVQAMMEKRIQELRLREEGRKSQGSDNAPAAAEIDDNNQAIDEVMSRNDRCLNDKDCPPTAFCDRPTRMCQNKAPAIAGIDDINPAMEIMSREDLSSEEASSSEEDLSSAGKIDSLEMDESREDRCMSDEDCPQTAFCDRPTGMCQNPCNPGPCRADDICHPVNHKPMCILLQHEEDMSSEGWCLNDEDCNQDAFCDKGMCQNPCNLGSCNGHICHPVDHKAMCIPLQHEEVDESRTDQCNSFEDCPPSHFCSYTGVCEKNTGSTCSTVWEEKCSDKPRGECTSPTKAVVHLVEECTTVKVAVPEMKCTYVTEEKCHTAEEEICHTSYDHKCSTKFETECNIEPSRICRTVYDSDCDKTVSVPKQESPVVPKKECFQKPREECQSVYERVCKQVPKKECIDVPREECKPFRREMCEPVTHQLCEEVPTYVSKQECKQVPKTEYKLNENCIMEKHCQMVPRMNCN